MKKLLGLVVIGGLMVLATPAPQAEAVSLINPAISAPIAAAAGSGITEVRWHRHHWRRHHWRRHHHHWRRWYRRHW